MAMVQHRVAAMPTAATHWMSVDGRLRFIIEASLSWRSGIVKLNTNIHKTKLAIVR
jgi:hypothetical protein